MVMLYLYYSNQKQILMNKLVNICWWEVEGVINFFLLFAFCPSRIFHLPSQL